MYYFGTLLIFAAAIFGIVRTVVSLWNNRGKSQINNKERLEILLFFLICSFGSVDYAILKGDEDIRDALAGEKFEQSVVVLKYLFSGILFGPFMLYPTFGLHFFALFFVANTLMAHFKVDLNQLFRMSISFILFTEMSLVFGLAIFLYYYRKGHIEEFSSFIYPNLMHNCKLLVNPNCISWVRGLNFT